MIETCFESTTPKISSNENVGLPRLTFYGHSLVKETEILSRGWRAWEAEDVEPVAIQLSAPHLLFDEERIT